MAERTIVTLGDTLAALVEGKKYTTLRDILVTMNAVDVAAVFEDMPQDKLPLLFRLLPKELAAETFVEMAPEAQELLIQGFSDNELKEVVDELYVDDAVDIVEEMPANVVKRILQQADPEMRKMINEILKYPDDSAGSIMTTSNDNRRTYNQQSSISFAGSNFYINDRQDAYALAVEIASLTRRQQRGRGLRMA